MVNPNNLHFRLPPHRQDVITEFHHDDDHVVDQSNDHQALWNPSRKQLRKLHTEIKGCAAAAQMSKDPCLVIEVFSPPRLSKLAHEAGFRGRSYDLQNAF